MGEGEMVLAGGRASLVGGETTTQSRLVGVVLLTWLVHTVLSFEVPYFSLVIRRLLALLKQNIGNDGLSGDYCTPRYATTYPSRVLPISRRASKHEGAGAWLMYGMYLPLLSRCQSM